MLALKEIKTSHERYPFVEALLQSAFPSDERRDDKEQRNFTNNNEKFHCLLIQDSGKPIGLITYWDFEAFVYVEHFAIREDQRRSGWGTKAMTLFLQGMNLPVVLEVEMPRVKGDITHRRIRFYRHIGFSLRKMAYEQPPYRNGDGWLPMKIMTYGKFNWLKMAGNIRETIYREVYGV